MTVEPNGYFDGFRAQLDIELRLCRETDLLLLEWFGAFTHQREIIREAYALQQKSEALMVLAMLWDFPVGQVWLDFRRKPNASGPMVWAARVIEPLRGLGIGRRSLGAVERLALEKGHRMLEVGVEKGNCRALTFYEQDGWQIVRELQESYSYTTPQGQTFVHHLDEWVLAKVLDPAGDGRPTRR